LLSLRIVRIIQMKVKVASDKKLVRSSRCKRQKGIWFSEKIRRNRIARLSGGRRRLIDIEDS